MRARLLAALVGIVLTARAQDVPQAVALADYLLEGSPHQATTESLQSQFGRLSRFEVDALKQFQASNRYAAVQFFSANLTWQDPAKITVAFKGGSPEIHKAIAEIAREWEKDTRIKFDFGENTATGEYRTWSDKDKDYVADIRVAFDATEGRWSRVGTDARTRVRHNRPSMNLPGFGEKLPTGWERTVRHEFGHALGLDHQLQHPGNTCTIKWQPDSGYVPTVDEVTKMYLPDPQGRKPGVYKFLSGPPNHWTADTTDANLGPKPERPWPQAFGLESVMRYHLPSWVFDSGVDAACGTPPPEKICPDDYAVVNALYPPVGAQTPKQLQQLLRNRAEVLRKEFQNR